MRLASIAAAAMLAAAQCTPAAVERPPADSHEDLGIPALELTGRVVDARTGKAITPAVVEATWVLLAEDARGSGPRTRHIVRQARSISEGSFQVLQRKQHIDLKGWKPAPGQDPVVRIYAKGYRRLVIENAGIAKGGKRAVANGPESGPWRWVGEGKTQSLQPLPQTALASELATWKKDLESALARSSLQDWETALRSQEKLLLLFDEACAALAAPPAKLCYAPDSELGRYLAQVKDERSRFVVVEEPDGQVRKYGISVDSTRASAAAQSGASSPTDSSGAMGFPGISRPK